MAILVSGKTVCRICGKVIQSTDGATLFPPFVSNYRDPLVFFSDGAFHEDCVEIHPFGAAARRRAAEIQSRANPDRRVCEVCGERITDPDDYVVFGFLTEDQDDPAVQFNFVQLHESHVPIWKRRDDAIAALERLSASGTWDGPTLDMYLIPILRGRPWKDAWVRYWRDSRKAASKRAPG